jgi:heptosyltransferase-1
MKHIAPYRIRVTALTHIAAAYETPTIEIYCDSPRWKTEGNWSDQIINVGDQGRPGTVAEVRNAIRTLLAHRALG